jgi:hypothetical protein
VSPYKSDAQRRKFHALEKEGKISKKTVEEFDKASEGLKLPERATPKARGAKIKSIQQLRDISKKKR